MKNYTNFKIACKKCGKVVLDLNKPMSGQIRSEEKDWSDLKNIRLVTHLHPCCFKCGDSFGLNVFVQIDPEMSEGEYELIYDEDDD